jgi:hypothetical protein
VAEVTVTVRWDGPEGRAEQDRDLVRRMLRGQAVRALYLVEGTGCLVIVDGQSAYPEPGAG